MGTKGDQATSEGAQTAALLSEKFTTLGNITTKKMFGGHGIFHDGKMFTMITSKGEALLKYDDSNKDQLLAAGGEPHVKMPYISITPHTIADFDQLIELATSAIAVSKK